MTTYEKFSEMLIEQLGVEANEINLDSEVINDLGADSLDIVELVMSIEEGFGIEIPDADIESHVGNCTVGKAIEYIDQAIKEQGGYSR